METTSKQSQSELIHQKRLQAGDRLEQWKKRNSSRLKGWDPIAVLRFWREKRWSSSTHQ